ncbi:MAG: alginate export family protein [Pseudomonadales bacterium]|nr:alginate export family protein [Pseudomonadales bacterium]
MAIKSRFSRISALAICMLAVSETQGNSHLDTRILAIISANGESASDLGLGNQSDDTAISASIRPSLLWHATDEMSFFSKGRLFYSTASLLQDSDEGGSSSDGFASLDELWGRYSFSPGQEGYSFKFGRQRIKETDSLWWDKDIDALRLSYNSTLLNGFIAAAQQLSAHRTDDSDFDERDEDILRIVGELEYEWHYAQSISIRTMWQQDYSDHIKAGNSLASIGADTEDLDGIWLGFRLKGSISDEPGRWGYFLDIGYLTGERQQISSTQQNQVLEVHDQSIDGWAVDIGGWREWDHYLKPKLGFHIAQTSSGNGFVQTGLQSNRAYLTDFNSRFYRYGELYRAELSNIRIYSLFSGIDWRRSHDLSVVLHHFTRLDNQAPVYSGGISTDPESTGSTLGSELDLIYGWNITDHISLQHTQNLGDDKNGKQSEPLNSHCN